MNKHTPGPWNVLGKTIMAKPDGFVKDQPAITAHTNFCDANWNANARLIATAPELLGACKELLEVLQDSEFYESSAVLVAKKAIARAEGGDK